MANFSDYLNFVCSDRRYDDTRSLYISTNALLSLEAQTVERQKSGDTKLEPPPKPLPVLEQFRTFALGEKREHLLLAGRPGSGKSTTLKQMLLEITEVTLTDGT